MHDQNPVPQNSPKSSPGWLSIAIIVIGLLVLIPSALCTLVFIPSAFSGNEYIGFPILLIVGGIPIIVGAALLYLGLWLRKKKRLEAVSSSDTTSQPW